MRDEAGRQRVVIERVTPEIDGGRFPVKRVVGETVAVEADAFTNGPDAITCRLLFRPLSQPQGAAVWSGAPMLPLPDDRWRGEFVVGAAGRWRYTVTGWVDHFKTWRRDLQKRVEDGRDAAAALSRGAGLIREAGDRAEAAGRKAEARILAALAQDLEAGADPAARLRLALDDELALLMDRYADRRFASIHRELEVVVDRERARFSSWYEMPRPLPVQEAEARLPDVANVANVADVADLADLADLANIAKMGFDVLSLAVPAGTAWTDEDFRSFRGRAGELGMEIALDLAVEGDFAADSWRALWKERADGVLRWIGQGVQIFRVDDPESAPFPFWEWLIHEVKREHPDVLFVAGAPSRPKRPKIAGRLAKLGFTQSCQELPASFAKLAESADREFLRPCFWLRNGLAPESAESAGRPLWTQRLILAATLGTSYGVGSAALERMLAAWDPDRPESLRELIALVNRIRRENPALHTDRRLRFHPTDNEQILCYSKGDDQGDNTVLVAVNLDPHYVQSAWVELPLADLGLSSGQPYQMHDLLTGARYLWHGTRNFVRLDPQSIPAHIFRVRRRVRSARGRDDFI